MVKLVARLTPGASSRNLGVDLVDRVSRERESRGSLDPRLPRRSETGCGDLARASILGDEKIQGKRRCRWRDSNPQGLSPARAADRQRKVSPSMSVRKVAFECDGDVCFRVDPLTPVASPG